MKTAVGLITATIITAIVAPGASAEWRLYVNRDNKAWSLERAYVSNGECDRAARALYRSGQALGVGCAEYPAPSLAQAPTPRSAEYLRSTSSIERQVSRVDEARRTSPPRAPRITEYPARSAPRSAPMAESHPAAVIFPPSGGIEIRREESPRAAVVAQASAQPRRQAVPATAQPNPVAQSTSDDDKNSAAVTLAKAATEASAASAREAEADAAKREAVGVADKAARRTTLAVFGGVALVMLAIITGVAYSVYRVARTSPLRGLAACLIEVGVLTAALAYPVVEMWTRLRTSESIVISWIPGLLAGIVIAGVGVIVLALNLTRKPARLRKPQAPVELIKPGEYIKTGEPSKPVEPVKPLQPMRPLEPIAPLEAPMPPDKPKWVAARPVEAAKPLEPAKPVAVAKPAEPVKPVEPAKPLQLVTPLDGAKQVEPAKPAEPVKPADAPARS